MVQKNVFWKKKIQTHFRQTQFVREITLQRTRTNPRVSSANYDLSAPSPLNSIEQWAPKLKLHSNLSWMSHNQPGEGSMLPTCFAPATSLPAWGRQHAVWVSCTQPREGSTWFHGNVWLYTEWQVYPMGIRAFQSSSCTSWLYNEPVFFSIYVDSSK